MITDTDQFGRNDECTWVEDFNGYWESECGATWEFIEDGPEENRVKFCHKCGGKLEIKPFAGDTQ